MWEPHTITHLITAALPHSYLMPFAIILGTFILEDATTILVAILAATGALSWVEALLSLWVGIAGGDMLLYAIGAYAHTHPRAKRFIAHYHIARLRSWIEGRLSHVVFYVRFVPGMRLPTYLACGFFRVPFSKFALTAIGAVMTWTTIFFFLVYFFGQATAQTLGVWRFTILLLPLVIHFVIRLRGKHKGTDASQS